MSSRNSLDFWTLKSECLEFYHITIDSGWIILRCYGFLRWRYMYTFKKYPLNPRSVHKRIYEHHARSIYHPTAQPRTEPYEPSCPTWQLYCIKREIFDLLREKFDWKMPSDIINDDLFLALLTFPRVGVTDKAFFYSHRPSFSDLLHTQIRILRWIRQLMDMGMTMQLQRFIDRISSDRDNSFMRRWKYRLIPFFTRFIHSWKAAHLWKIAQSTKHPVNNSQAHPIIVDV